MKTSYLHYKSINTNSKPKSKQSQITIAGN